MTDYTLLVERNTLSATPNGTNVDVSGSFGVKLVETNNHANVKWDDWTTLSTAARVPQNGTNATVVPTRSARQGNSDVSWHLDAVYEAEQGGDGQLAMTASLTYGASSYSVGTTISVGAR